MENNNDIEKISEIVKRVLNRISNKIEKEDIRKNPIIDWEKIWIELFPEESIFTEVLGVKNKNLLIKVKSSVWLMELKKRKPDIKKTIEKRTEYSLLDIKFFR
ncbi:MAG: DUF721 domain-containing protein [Candidatus Omnitrophica bacterium]|jgi:hypothetical protein|nr:DUF721 domain-containing protein [Candidatus Omnitrophota bacterium]